MPVARQTPLSLGRGEVMLEGEIVHPGENRRGPRSRRPDRRLGDPRAGGERLLEPLLDLVAAAEARDLLCLLRTIDDHERR